MLRILSIILCAIALQAQTNQKPYRLLVANGKLVVSGGKILNHQTYVATRLAGTASGSGGFGLSLEQTNALLETSIADWNNRFAAVANEGLFAVESIFGNDRLTGYQGLQSSVPAGGSRAASYSYYVSTWAGSVVESSQQWDVSGTFGVPQKFFMRPTAPYSELSSIDVSAPGAIVQLIREEGASFDLVSVSNSASIAHSELDDVSGFRAAISGWRNVSYSTTHQYDNDFATNGVDPVTHESWSISSGLHELFEDINLPSGWEDPVSSAVWRFQAIKEYY